MLEDSDRLLGTIEQVLRAGQLGARVRHAGYAAVDLSALVEDCISLARTRYRLGPDALSYRHTSPDGGRTGVLGDEDELKAVVANLVDNAVKYSGPDVKVNVELEQTDAFRATLRVRDRGVGISPSERKRIFRRFYRVPGTMRIKGTGLGLFIRPLGGARHRGQGVR